LSSSTGQRPSRTALAGIAYPSAALSGPPR
jgi:hypothetical protein